VRYTYNKFKKRDIYTERDRQIDRQTYKQTERKESKADTMENKRKRWEKGEREVERGRNK
jgi:hypothetical protein